MKRPPNTPRDNPAAGNRISKHIWAEIEELYRQGWSQADLCRKYIIRKETMSRHMKNRGIKGGEAIEKVRAEVELQVSRRSREFHEKRAMRTIQAKENAFTMLVAVQGAFAREFKAACDRGAPMGALVPSARAFKDITMALRQAREEAWLLLDIKPDNNGEELPEIVVGEMSAERVAELRARGVDVDEFKEAAENLANTLNDADNILQQAHVAGDDEDDDPAAETQDIAETSAVA